MGALVIIKEWNDGLWIIFGLVDQNSDGAIIFCSLRLIEVFNFKTCHHKGRYKTKSPFVRWCCCSSTQGNVLGVVAVGQNSENRSGEEERGKTAQGGQSGASITVGERQSL